MTDTSKTPLQFPDDDRLLLRQLFGLVQTLVSDMQDVKTRLTALENSRDTVGRLDKLVLAVAETRYELGELRQEVRDLRQEVKQNSQGLKDLRQEVATFREEVNARLDKSEFEFSSHRSVTKTAIYDLSFRQEYIESRMGRLDKIEQRLDMLEKKAS